MSDQPEHKGSSTQEESEPIHPVSPTSTDRSEDTALAASASTHPVPDPSVQEAHEETNNEAPSFEGPFVETPATIDTSLSLPEGTALSPSYRPQHEEFQPSDFFVMFFIYIAVSMLAFGVASAFVPMPSTVMKQAMGLGVTLLADLCILVMFWFRGRVVYRFSWPELGFRWPTWKQLGLWILIFYPSVLLFTNGYIWLLKVLFGIPEPKQGVATLLGADMPLSVRSLAVVLILVLAPLCEEVLYRRVLFRSLTTHFRVHYAAVMSGLLFGVAHFEVQVIVPLAFLGTLLALAYHYTRSLWLVIALHAGNNLLAFVALFWR